MAELVAVMFSHARDDMSQHIDRLYGFIENLRSLDTVFDDSLALGILVASTEVSELFPITAAINTRAGKDPSWYDVSSRLIEEAKDLQSGNGRDRATAASSG